MEQMASVEDQAHTQTQRQPLVLKTGEKLLAKHPVNAPSRTGEAGGQRHQIALS